MSEPALVLSALPLESTDSDEQIVARILGGEPRYFAVLIRRHNQKLFRLTRSIVKSDQDAEDVVQTTYVRAFHKLEQFRSEARFSTWLGRIAVNEALHCLKDRQRASGVAQVAAEEPSPRSERSPEELTHQSQVKRILERHIDALPDTLRSVLVMRDVHDLSTEDTASTLGISEEAVRVRLHRARNLMEQRVGGLRARAPEAFRFLGARCERMLYSTAERLGLGSG